MINEDTLALFIKAMTECDIIWGVGGSYLLEKYELYTNPADLDLWIQADDMPVVRQKFSHFEELNTNIPLPKEYHYKIQYYDMEVDFVACFIVKEKKYKYQYSINPDNIKQIELSSGLQIPCLYLEDWYVIYKLLRREDKANLIRDAFKKLGIVFNEEAVNKSIKSKEDNNLPKWLLHDISDFSQEINQLSMFDQKKLGIAINEKAARNSTKSSDTKQPQGTLQDVSDIGKEATQLSLFDLTTQEG